MIKVRKLSEQKGGESYGTCNSCSAFSSENATLVRITFTTDYGQGTSICLCEKCLTELFYKLKGEFDIRGDNNEID